MNVLIALDKVNAAAIPSSYWVQTGTIEKRQGWKLYVSSNAKDFPEVERAVSKAMQSLNVCFKAIASPQILRRQNAGEFGFSQIGKNLVVYSESNESAREIALSLIQVLQCCCNRGPEIPFARALSRTLGIYYRFGRFRVDLEAQDDFEDCRHGIPVLPLHTIDPLTDFAEKNEDANLNKFLTFYPIYKSLVQTGKGGVFLALDIKSVSFNEVVVKLGRRNGCILDDGRDGFDLLTHEYQSLLKLQNTLLSNSVPQILDYAEFGFCNCLVLKRFSGPDLMVAKQNGSLSINDVNGCLEILERLGEEGFSHGDAKLANFVRDVDSLHLIDLESLQADFNNTANQLPTFYLKNVSGVVAKHLDRIHFLVSVLFDYSNNERNREVDPADLLVSSPATEVEEFALERLRALLGSYYHPVNFE